MVPENFVGNLLNPHTLKKKNLSGFCRGKEVFDVGEVGRVQVWKDGVVGGPGVLVADGCDAKGGLDSGEVKNCVGLAGGFQGAREGGLEKGRLEGCLAADDGTREPWSCVAGAV